MNTSTAYVWPKMIKYSGETQHDKCTVLFHADSKERAIELVYALSSILGLPEASRNDTVSRLTSDWSPAYTIMYFLIRTDGTVHCGWMGTHGTYVIGVDKHVQQVVDAVLDKSKKGGFPND